MNNDFGFGDFDILNAIAPKQSEEELKKRE